MSLEAPRRANGLAALTFLLLLLSATSLSYWQPLHDLGLQWIWGGFLLAGVATGIAAFAVYWRLPHAQRRYARLALVAFIAALVALLIPILVAIAWMIVASNMGNV